jgi:hypothetical protein
MRFSSFGFAIDFPMNSSLDSQDAWLANGGGQYNNPQFAIKNIDGLPDGMLSFTNETTAKMGLLGSAYSTSVIGNYVIAQTNRHSSHQPIGLTRLFCLSACGTPPYVFDYLWPDFHI